MKKSRWQRLYLKALKNRAYIYEMIGDYTNSLKDIEKILSYEYDNPFFTESLLDKLSIMNTINKIESPIEQLKDLIKTFEIKNDKKNLSKAVMILVNILNEKGKYEESLRYLDYLEKKNAKKDIKYLIMFSRGTIYWNIGEINKALEIYKQLEKMNISDQYTQFKLYNNISLIYSDFGDEKKEHLYLNKAYNLSLKIGYTRGSGIALLNLASFYTKINELNRAEFTLRKALMIFKKIDFILAIEIVYSNLASIKLKKFQWKKGEYYIKKALKIAKKIGYKRGILTNYINMGITNLKMGKYKIAQYYFDETIKLANELNNSHLKIMCFIYYAELFYKLKDMDMVKRCLEKSLSLIFEKKKYNFLKEVYLIFALYYYHIDRHLSIRILKKSLFLAEKEKDYFQYIMDINEYIYNIDDKKLKNQLEPEIEKANDFKKKLLI